VTNLNTGIVRFGSVQFVLDGQPNLAPARLDPSGEAAIVVSGFDPGDVVVAGSVPRRHRDAGRVTVTNTRGSTLHSGPVTLAGADPQDFAVATDGCGGKALEPASSSTPAGACAVVVRFAPTAAGARTAALQLASDAPEGPARPRARREWDPARRASASASADSAADSARARRPRHPGPEPDRERRRNGVGEADMHRCYRLRRNPELLYPGVGGAKRAVIADARFTIVPGRTSAVTLRLNSTGRGLLRRSRQGRVHVAAARGAGRFSSRLSSRR
jgi:hypothetical protein